MAISSLGLVELVLLAINNRFTIANIAAATFGLLLILIFEGQRYKNEIKNQQRINLLRRESERDDLTGLLNYRALSQEIKALTQNRSIHNIVIGGLDIDHFKKINDTYGHFVGNEVLNHFSTVLCNRIHTAFPNHGYVYRFGGEEFSIVVSNHSIKEVYSVLQLIEEEMAGQPITTKEGITVFISFSASLTNHLNGEQLDDTLKWADKMLYSVKNSGRGWIVTDHHTSVKKVHRIDR
ncbi:GGDEF domain-containing protein [Limosilactobacillus pontis]|uniref:GGDEF domain-containing protein n=1 Tax=Limosilactobacillus pontis TaxID=35787 RepID=A0ABU7SSC0_9LACO